MNQIWILLNLRIGNFFKTIIALAGGIAMAGCGTDKVEPSNVPVPEVLAVSADAQVSSADINAVIANPESMTGSGFYYGKQYDNMLRIECTAVVGCICAHIDSLEAST